MSKRGHRDKSKPSPNLLHVFENLELNHKLVSKCLSINIIALLCYTAFNLMSKFKFKVSFSYMLDNVYSPRRAVGWGGSYHAIDRRFGQARHQTFH